VKVITGVVIFHKESATVPGAHAFVLARQAKNPIVALSGILEKSQRQKPRAFKSISGGLR
jgi:hypothetical protein